MHALMHSHMHHTHTHARTHIHCTLSLRARIILRLCLLFYSTALFILHVQIALFLFISQQESEQMSAPLRKGAFNCTYRLQFPTQQLSTCSLTVNCHLTDAAHMRWYPLEADLCFHFRNSDVK